MSNWMAVQWVPEVYSCTCILYFRYTPDEGRYCINQQKHFFMDKDGNWVNLATDNGDKIVRNKDFFDRFGFKTLEEAQEMYDRKLVEFNQ